MITLTQLASDNFQRADENPPSATSVVGRLIR